MEPAPEALLDRRSSEELAELRRRAYGPGADIDRDPAALARLEELESLGRAAPAPSVVSSETTNRTVSEPASASIPSATPEPPMPDDESPDEPSEPTPDRRRIRWVWVAAAVVAVIAAIATFTFFTRSQADETLVRASVPISELPSLLRDGGFLGYIEVEQDTFVEYESYRGIVPWVAPRTIGGSCVILVLNDEAIGYGCGLGGLSPVADLVVDRTDERWRDFDLRDGSILRFTLRGDVLDVQVGEAPSPAPTVND